nr:acyltransferase [uncultured Butyrivibrio sp.]
MGIEIKRRYEAIDGLRAFACMGIVAMHVFANASYELNGFWFKTFIPSLSNLVFLFMTISAFGMCCGYYKQIIDRELDVVSFYRKRYVKILPFFMFLCVLAFFMRPSLNSAYEVFANLTLLFGFIPNANISIIGVGWFLGVVFAFYIFFPFFCFLLADKKRAWIAFFASYFMNYLCRNHFEVGRKSIVYCFVYFMAGGLIYLYREWLTKVARYRWIFIVAAIISVITFWETEGPDFLMVFFNSAILAYAICSDRTGILDNKFTHLVGKISFEVYLSHMVVFRLAQKMHLLSLSNNAYISFFIAFIIIFISTCCLAMGVKKIMELFIDIARRILEKRIC